MEKAKSNQVIFVEKCGELHHCMSPETSDGMAVWLWCEVIWGQRFLNHSADAELCSNVAMTLE